MKFLQLIIILLLSSNIYAQKICFEKNGEIYVSNVDGSNLVQLVEGRNPIITRDGKTIIFEALRNFYQPHIAYINIKQKVVQLFKSIPYSVSEKPHLSSDGKHIIFKYLDNYEWKLGIVDLKDTKFSDLSNIDSTITAMEPPKEPIQEVFVKVENPAQFLGGSSAWKRYVEKNLNIQKIKDTGAPDSTYVVKIQFLVDKEGNISEIKALNNPGFGIAEEAVRVIKNSAPWKPAVQNGKPVVYRVVQGITFQITPSSK